MFHFASARGSIPPMIVTIDGPAGSGKSTAARKLAARLEIAYLDTGAMNRAVAYAAQQQGVDFDDDATLLETARSAHLELDCGPTHTRIRINGHDVSELIRTMAVSEKTPFIARNQAIRDILVSRQRDIGRRLGSVISEGRDQGSVVFPDADVRFVLDASMQKRAERRHQELLADGEDVKIAEVVANLTARDSVDARQWEPLLDSETSVVIDTTDMTISQVVNRMSEIVAARPASRTK